MEIETLLEILYQLKMKLVKREVILKDYCNNNSLSYTSTSRILNKDLTKMNLRTCYKILGLTPERKLSSKILDFDLSSILLIKQNIKGGLI